MINDPKLDKILKELERQERINLIDYYITVIALLLIGLAVGYVLGKMI